MKKRLLFLVALFVTTMAFAYEAEIDGIYYDFDHENKTAMVTHDGTPGDGTGYVQTEIIIPEKVYYNENEYIVTSIFSALDGVFISGAFVGCSSLTSIEIPNSVTSIGDYTFYECTGLASIKIGNGVTSIGKYAFYNCTGLTSIEIPNSVTLIEEYPFYNCTGLRSVKIGNGVSIVDNLFLGCTGLVSIDVENDNQYYVSIDGILYNKNMTALVRCPEGKTSVEIPNSVTSIGKYAFLNCIKVASIEISNSVTTIEEGAFYYCTGLTSIKIGNGVTSIGKYAFYDCTGLTSILLPNSVTEISSVAFWGCSELTSIDVEKDNQNYASVDGVLYNKNITTIIRCPESKTLIEIPNSVTMIGNNAFGYTGLTAIEIPNSVTTIGSGAFFGCAGLLAVKIPNSVTSIGKEAFRDCTSLISITIPNSVTSIGQSAFYNCTGLTSIEIRIQNPPIIGSHTFNKVSPFVQIKVPCGSKVKYQTAEYWWEFMNYEEFSPKLTAGVNDETMGFVTITKQNSCTDDVAQVQAQALAGYEFVRWSDGATENPHILLVTEDMTITAEFAPVGTETSVDKLEATTINIYSNNGVLYVDGLSVDYQVFDVNGRLVYSGSDAALALPRGVYVVVVEGEVEKVVL